MIRHVLLTLVFGIIASSALAAPAIKRKPPKAPNLAGTTWVGETAEGAAMTIEFLESGGMSVSYNMNTYIKASWTQDGDKIIWEMNQHYSEFDGIFKDGAIEGKSHNVTGKEWTTRLTRVPKE